MSGRQRETGTLVARESAAAWGEGWQQLGGVAVDAYGLLAMMAAGPAPNVVHELSSVPHRIGLRAAI
jgi:hypothetical protein